jgi:tripeptidyl-peptidase-1
MRFCIGFSYGAHLSKVEVDALIAPHRDTAELVNEWLAHHDIDSSSVTRTAAGDWLTINIPVSRAEKMLGAKYKVYHNPEFDSYVVRTESYSLPRDLHEHVNVVAPTTYFGNMRGMRATHFLQPDPEPEVEVGNSKASANPTPGAVPTSCNNRITPACLMALYNTTSYTPQATDTNRIGVAGYLDEFANNADLQVKSYSHAPSLLCCPN